MTEKTPEPINPLANMVGPEIMAHREKLDDAIKSRHEKECADLKERHASEKEAHRVQQKHLKALAEAAPQQRPE